MESWKSAGTSEGSLEPSRDCGRRVRPGGGTRAGGAIAGPGPVACGTDGAWIISGLAEGPCVVRASSAFLLVRYWIQGMDQCPNTSGTLTR